MRLRPSRDPADYRDNRPPDAFARPASRGSWLADLLTPAPPPVIRDDRGATLRYSVSRLDGKGVDQNLRRYADRLGLRYSSTYGKGLLLRYLTARVEGDTASVDRYVDVVSTWVHNPMVATPGGGN